MRLGIIQNQYTTEGFDKVVKQGFPFIEICCNHDEDMQNLINAKESIKTEMKRTGIDISSIGRWNHDLQENGGINEEKLKMYIELLDTAVELGAKTFVCGINYDKSTTLFRNYQNAVSFFRTICDHAKGTGIKVAVQNCNWNNFVVSPEQWKVVLGEVEDLWIKFDASHAYNRGDDYLAELSDWGRRVAHVHVKGTTIAGSTKVADPPAGMDDIRWSSLFSILYSIGYDGDLSIEPHSKVWGGELGDKGVIFTKNFISQYLL